MNRGINELTSWLGDVEYLKFTMNATTARVILQKCLIIILTELEISVYLISAWYYRLKFHLTKIINHQN